MKRAKSKPLRTAPICGAVDPSKRFVCTEDKGHEGVHVARAHGRFWPEKRAAAK
jgi:hypothetical protein